MPPQGTGSDGNGAKPSDPALGRLFDQYATLAGGWYLEQRCNTMAPELKDEFEWNIAQTNIALGRRSSPSFLMRLQGPAKDVAAKYPCNAETTTLIAQMAVLSRQTTLELTGERYSPIAKIKYDASRLAEIWSGRSIDDRCHFMPVDVRKAYDDRLDRMLVVFAGRAGEPAKDRLEVLARNADLAKLPCSNETKVYLQNLDRESLGMFSSYFPPAHAGPIKPDTTNP